MKLANGKSVALATFICVVLLLATAGSAAAQAPPPIPSVYSGSVTMGDEPAPDGAEVWAKIEDYSSHSVTVFDRQYEFLLVAPPSSSYQGKTIEFYVNDIKADQTDLFQSGTVHVFDDAFDLTIPSMPLMAAFTATPTSGEAPLTVQFTDNSIGEVTEWLWSFGDGETSNVQNPSHTYTSGGRYTVSLTVSGPWGSDTQTKIDYITVLSFYLSNLSISPTEVNIGETVTISVLVTNTGGVADSCTVTLKINGLVEATKDVTVAAGGSEQVSFSVSKDVAGTYWVDVDGLSGSFEVRQPGAEFTLSDLTITPAEVNVGETVTISVLVTNTGDVDGSYNVTFKINGVVEATEEVTVAAGGSEQVSFSVSKEAAGTYWVDVDGLAGSFEVKQAGTEFTLSNLTITPTEVNVGETLTISVWVTNTGDVDGSYNITLKINGAAEATKDVTVAAGSSEQVGFSTAKGAAGSYSVDVGGLTGSFKVVQKTTAPPESSSPPGPPGPPPASPANEVNWPLIPIIVGVASVVGVVSYLLGRRRRAH